MASPPGNEYVGMLDLLDCPICMHFMYPPIYQCRNGHSLCSNCKPKVGRRCPTCKDVVPRGNRSLGLEKAAALHRFPCKYSDDGCLERFMYSSKRDHEQQHCRHRPHICPFPSCQVGVPGNAAGLVAHMKDAHGAGVKDGCRVDSLFTVHRDLDDGDETYMLDIYSCYSKHFCLHVDDMIGTGGDYIYIYLTFVGEEMDAKTFSYDLAVGNGRREITLRGGPRSNRELSKPSAESYDGLILHRSMLHMFAETSIDDKKCVSSEEFYLRVRGFIYNINRFA